MFNYFKLKPASTSDERPDPSAELVAAVAERVARIQPQLTTQAPAWDSQRPWEDLVCLNSGVEPNFTILGPPRDYVASDRRLNEWKALDYEAALERDLAPLPLPEDREGYYGPDHFSYWASGLHDTNLLLDAARQHGRKVSSYFDLGCASGRVLRHFAAQHPDLRGYGADINRLHVEWCNLHLPANCVVFQNSSIPSLPFQDNSIDLISAYSVFTHIEAFETSWLMEISRILRPGGIAWVTVHTEHTLKEMTPDWPLWNPVMSHPDAASKLDADRGFEGNRLVMRWHGDRSYASNVFYKTEYLRKVWGRILEVVEFRRRCPTFQDVLILRKRP